MFDQSQNYAASEEWILDFGFERLQKKNPKECNVIIELNRFYEEHSTFPISGEKNIIAVFRLSIGLNNYIEELLKIKD